ncbi:MAG: UvrD-helicase domain-containing protein, partial [Candidatus Kapabacteria bacterium]|nr:UvrD-helicase domain-containing protein [Candidatus Kapabacteria bacterium]
MVASVGYSARKRERNALDFDDMIRMVIDLLGNNEIATSIRSGIRYLMVDEFQDTDPEQYRLLELLVPALTQSAVAGPNLFIVGDDKQSIYGFRDADVRLFRKATQAIRMENLAANADDGYRPLARSYRMHQDLCTVVNGICSHIFGSVEGPEPDDLFSYDVSYSALVAGLTVPHFDNVGTCSVVYDEENEIGTVANTIVQI